MRQFFIQQFCSKIVVIFTIRPFSPFPPLLILYKVFMQNLLTSSPKSLILKIAFVIIRRLQKPHYSSKTKIKQKQTKKITLRIQARHYSKTKRSRQKQDFGAFSFTITHDPKNIPLRDIFLANSKCLCKIRINANKQRSSPSLRPRRRVFAGRPSMEARS